MLYDLAQIKRDVRTILDENTQGEPLFEDVGTLTVDKVIESRVLEAVRSVEYSAPVHLINESEPIPYKSIQWFGDLGKSGGRLALPSDFMRLVSFRMNDWHKAVTTAIGADSPQYAKQKSPFAGVRGNATRPVVAIVHEGGENYLEFYSCSGGEGVEVADARYLKMPEAMQDKVFVVSNLYTAMLYECAYLVGVTFSLPNIEILRNVAKEHLSV